ncbi:MAG: mannose-1-phosphate guanylyltransferase [Parachlamydiales bacterium]|nr:mannose-1-phosphate guanylyltransferase [Parachlamydiales bacterium]
MHYKIILLAGGSGKRLWPLSTKNCPKQFLQFGDRPSFYQQTLTRSLHICDPSEILVVTNVNYEKLARQQAKIVGVDLNDQIIAETDCRNTAPAIALTLVHAVEKEKWAKDTVLFLFPSDHHIEPEEALKSHINDAVELAQRGYLVTFGIKPTRPEVGYGYLHVKDPLTHIDGYELETFVEKPDKKKAEAFLKTGEYFWNAGIFAFTIETMWQAFKDFQPEIFEWMEKGYDEMYKNFAKIKDISIDYAIFERAKKIAMIPLNAQWIDIGSWDSVYEWLDKDERGNVIIGNAIEINAQNSFIYTTKNIVGSIDLDNHIFISTDTQTLIIKRGSSCKMRDLQALAAKLEGKLRKEGIVTFEINEGEELLLNEINHPAHLFVKEGELQVTTVTGTTTLKALQSDNLKGIFTLKNRTKKPAIIYLIGHEES